MKLFKRKYMNQQEVILMQIYGELNRIRLILGANTKIGKKILEGDKLQSYDPFFDTEDAYDRYKAIKIKK